MFRFVLSSSFDSRVRSLCSVRFRSFSWTPPSSVLLPPKGFPVPSPAPLAAFFISCFPRSSTHSPLRLAIYPRTTRSPGYPQESIAFPELRGFEVPTVSPQRPKDQNKGPRHIYLHVSDLLIPVSLPVGDDGATVPGVCAKSTLAFDSLFDEGCKRDSAFIPPPFPPPEVDKAPGATFSFARGGADGLARPPHRAEEGLSPGSLVPRLRSAV